MKQDAHQRQKNSKIIIKNLISIESDPKIKNFPSSEKFSSNKKFPKMSLRKLFKPKNLINENINVHSFIQKFLYHTIYFNLMAALITEKNYLASKTPTSPPNDRATWNFASTTFNFKYKRIFFRSTLLLLLPPAPISWKKFEIFFENIQLRQRSHFSTKPEPISSTQVYNSSRHLRQNSHLYTHASISKPNYSIAQIPTSRHEGYHKSKI